MKSYQNLFIFFLILITHGCANSSGMAYSGEQSGAVVISSGLSGEGLGQSAGLTWIDSEKELISVMNKLNRNKLGGSSPALPVIDYDHEGFLLIRMGQKPTGGYRIELASEKVLIRDRTAIISIRWIEPGKGAILAQMITSPCILIRVTKAEFNRIQVVDQNGTVRAETAAGSL
jgi:hypothetical protein